MWYIGSTTDLAPLPPSQGLSPLTEDALLGRGLSPGSAASACCRGGPVGARVARLPPVISPLQGLRCYPPPRGGPLCNPGPSAPWRLPGQVRGISPGVPGRSLGLEDAPRPWRGQASHKRGSGRGHLALPWTALGGFVWHHLLNWRRGCDGQHLTPGETEAQRANEGYPGKLQGGHIQVPIPEPPQAGHCSL